MHKKIDPTLPKLEEVEWGEFNLNDADLFSLYSTKSGIDKINLDYNGECIFPFITRSEKDNGLNDLVPNQIKPLNEGNTISIGLDTQTVFYQPNNYYTGQNIQVLSNTLLNKEIALFVIPMLKIQLQNLSWGGSGATLSRLKAKRILLPITKDRTPDWNYMEQYIVNIIKTIKVPKLEPIRTSNIDLNSVNWLPVQLGDLFIPRRGNSGPKNKLKPGETVLISARKIDNGFDSMVTPPEKSTIYSDILTVNNNGDGGAGIAYYHPYKFIATQDVTLLIPKFKLSKYSKLFISLAITSQRAGMGFGFGNKLNGSRLERLSIMLPVKLDKSPNWKFMEDYVKSISNSRLL
ncbi:restriction endonuclease subunit S [Enterococcus faecalis]|uniref:restriction endonuclease subunit S n=1 Tax=Enterococcus faecalis TaxID=1351 RepID=UPI003981D1D9